MKLFFFILLMGMSFGKAFSAVETIQGEIHKLRFHQMLDGSTWDEQIWFCLNTDKVVSSCGVTTECSGKNAIIISKNASKDIVSAVLAAKMTKHAISVQVDDTFKFGDHCYARVIDL